MCDNQKYQTLDDISSIVKLAGDHQKGDWLFRGQRTCECPIPRIFRPSATNGIAFDKVKCGLEPRLGHEFRDYAHSVNSNCPGPEEYLEWLALMQHHSAPTRLLDWTRSPLVAAFFSVEIIDPCDESKDGSFWVLNSGQLTEITREAHRNGIKAEYECTCKDRQKKRDQPFSVVNAAIRLAEQAFADHRFRKKNECAVNGTCRFPLAIAPPRTFSRLATQRSWFTIHPTSECLDWAKPKKEKFRNGEDPLKLCEIKDKQGRPILAKYVIPGKCKESIRHALGALGVTRATLFADLDGLGASLIPELRRRFPD